MSRRYRSRRTGKPPVFTSADAKLWRKLIREARAAAAIPTLSGGDFAAAAHRVGSAAFPWPVLRGAEKPDAFVELIATAKAWPTAMQAAREAGAAGVLALCAICERIMGGPAPPGPPPNRRERADIDG